MTTREVIEVKIKVFANLRDKVPIKTDIAEAFTMDVKPNTTISQIITELTLEQEDVQISMVNGVPEQKDYKIEKEGLLIALFSPAGGG